MWSYQRVLKEMRAKITPMPPDAKLPTRLELAAEYGVSHMTVQKAIDALKDEGLLYSVPGLGVFVSGE